MPKNVMKLIAPSPHRARNDFDLSHRHVYTLNFGELLPVSQIETVPGDHIEFSVANLVRCMPLATSPFLRAKQHFDVWFVPYRDLWHNFDSFITQREQPVSSALKASSYCPREDFNEVISKFGALTSSDTDVVGHNLEKGCKKIYDLLGYGRIETNGSSVSGSFNIFRLLAYNYIWYNEYRNKYFDDGTYNIPINLLSIYNAAVLFNADAMQCDTVAHSKISGSYAYSPLVAMFQMRYRQWKKDLFTGLLPSQQFGAVSSLTSKSLASTALALSNGTATPPSGSITASGGTALAGGQPFGLSANAVTSSVSILDLRKAEALQIWRENALRSGNRVADNMRGHYGVESDFRDHRPTYLGSVDAPLNISDIDSTAQTGQNQNGMLGDIAGKGLSTIQNKTFKFDAKDFGVIMVLHSILPEAEYMSTGCDRNNQLLESEDFFIPEYERLGFEGVASGNFMMKSGSQHVVGYAPRYYGYKQKMDKCFGEFWSGGTLSQWCSPRTDVNQVLAATGAVSGIYPIGCLYVKPSLFDNNFAAGVNVTDQFICDTYFDVDAVRPMSVMGLPYGD